MSIEAVRVHLARFGRAGDILEPEASTATVQLAAEALGTEPGRIAKTLSFYENGGDGAVIVVVAGDAKIDNAKFRGRFGYKARMLGGDDVERLTGHGVGGVCPFALPAGTPVYLDESLRRFDRVYPACGSPSSAIRLTLGELEEYAGAEGWVDVCKMV